MQSQLSRAASEKASNWYCEEDDSLKESDDESNCITHSDDGDG